MTPLEINKTIAKIKGLTIFNAEKHSQTDDELNYDLILDVGHLWILDNDGQQHIWSPAENISDAWELFEEMPFLSSIHKTSDHYEVHSGDFFNKLEKYDSRFWEASNTAPLAICEAWINWKQGKDE